MLFHVSPQCGDGIKLIFLLWNVFKNERRRRYEGQKTIDAQVYFTLFQL